MKKKLKKIWKFLDDAEESGILFFVVWIAFIIYFPYMVGSDWGAWIR
jgi:hypothetical protein